MFDVDTLIRMNDGTVKFIDEITEGDFVIDTKGCFTKVISTQGQTQVDNISVKTKLGREFNCSPDTKIITSAGVKSASELKVGNLLRIQRSDTYNDRSGRSLDEFYLAGYTVANSFNKEFKRYEGTEFEKDEFKSEWCYLNAVQRNLFVKIAKSLDFKMRPHSLKSKRRRIVFTDKKYIDWCKHNSVFFQSINDRRIPDWVYQGSKEKIAAFIVAYCDCTSIWNPSKGMGVTASNHTLMKAFRRLLLMVGVDATLNFLTDKRNPKYTNSRVTFFSGAPALQLLSLATKHSPRLFIDETVELPFESLHAEDAVKEIIPSNKKSTMIDIKTASGSFLAEDLAMVSA